MSLPKKKRSPRLNLLTLLAGGDRRSLGRANSVVTMVLANVKLFPQLFAGLWDDDPVVRMRAADAAEKISAARPQLLQPFKSELLGLADESLQQEVQWHLALMLPRLQLNSGERRRAVSRLREYLQGRSAIVKTHALQGLWELSRDDGELRDEVLDLLAEASRSGTPAMKARARKLLASQSK